MGNTGTMDNAGSVDDGSTPENGTIGVAPGRPGLLVKLPGASTPPLIPSAVQSVDRAITALEFLARDGQAGVSAVAAAIGVHKSTASRLLGALQSRGLVEVAGDRGRYRLGYGILRLAGAMGGRLDVTSQGREICEELAILLGETVNLAVVQGDAVVNVYQAHGGGAISVNNWVGRPTPLHATSSGKVLMAYLSRSAQDRVIAAGLARFTPGTVVDGRLLRRQLGQVHRDGYAVTAGEYETGLNAVSAPVFGTADLVIAAVSASGPAYRFPAGELPQTATAVIAAAARISERMGHLG